MNHIKFVAAMLLVAVLGFTTACNDDPKGPTYTISVSNPDTDLTVGDEVSVKVTVNPADGFDFNNVLVTFSEKGIVNLDRDGGNFTLTAEKEGETTMTVSYGDFKKEITFTVGVSIKLGQVPTDIIPSDVFQLEVTTSSGIAIKDLKLSLSADNVVEATPTETGFTITALEVGKTNLTVKYNDTEASAAITVRAPQTLREHVRAQSVLIPATETHFLMGSATNEPSRGTDEDQHKVKITKPFRISKFEITNKLYALFLNEIGVGANGFVPQDYSKDKLYGGGASKNDALVSDARYQGAKLLKKATKTTPAEYGPAPCPWGVTYNTTSNSWEAYAGYENFPVIYVSWYGAMEFAHYIGASLPTEAQWEYAAMGGNSKADGNYYGIGKQAPYNYASINGMANFGKGAQEATIRENGEGGTEPVDQYNPNAYGLYNMHGNVAEWCLDWYDAKYGNTSVSSTEVYTDPINDSKYDSNNPMRVLKGGAWNSNGQKTCRAASRLKQGPTMNSNATYGFRVVFND